MSHEATMAVWEQSQMTGSAKLLMLALAHFTHPEKGIAWPSQKRLAGYVGVKRRRLRRLLRHCQEAGELNVTPGCGRRSSRYRITLLDRESQPENHPHLERAQAPADPQPARRAPDARDRLNRANGAGRASDHGRDVVHHALAGVTTALVGHGQKGASSVRQNGGDGRRERAATTGGVTTPGGVGTRGRGSGGPRRAGGSMGRSGGQHTPRNGIKKQNRKERERGSAATEDPEGWLRRLDLPLPRDDVQREQVNHPAVRTWLEVTGRWPGYEVLPVIVDRLGETPNARLLQDAWRDWLAHGYRSQNVAGVLDFYQQRGGGGQRRKSWTEAEIQAWAAQMPVFRQEEGDGDNAVQ